MYNPVQNSYSVHCYGKFGSLVHCNDCTLRNHCRKSAEANRLTAAFSDAGEYIETLPAPEQQIETEEPDKGVKQNYTRAEMLRLINFFLYDISPTSFMLIALKIKHPEYTVAKLAKIMHFSSSISVYQRFSEICGKCPEMRDILYRKYNRKTQEQREKGTQSK